jgi:hypothetical protein
VMSIFAILAGVLWGAPWRWGQGQRILKAFRRSILVGVAALFLMALLFPDSILATWSFYSETLDPRSSASELRARTVDYPLVNFERAFQFAHWPTGYGTGTSSLGGQYVQRLLGPESRSVGGVENGYGTLIVEMGILGLILWIFWSSVFLVCAWKVVISLRQTVYFPVAFAIFWYSFLLLVPFTYGGMSPYQNFVMNAYFWLLAGVLFRLPHLAKTPQLVPAEHRAPRMAAFPALVGGR